MKRPEIIAALLEQARDKDTLANGDPNSIFASDALVLRAAALMLFAVVWHPQPCESYESRCLQSSHGTLARAESCADAGRIANVYRLRLV